MKYTKLLNINSASKLLAICCVLGMSLSLSVHAQERGSRDEQRPKPPQFSELDLDGDGSVTFAEFAQSKVPNDDHEKIFGHIDADGDGTLTEEEITSHKPPRRKR